MRTARLRRSIVVGIACATSLTLAQKPPRVEVEDQARKHFANAQAHFAGKDYAQAAAEYQAAYDLVPKAGLLFNIGLCRENLGDAAGAIQFYERFLSDEPEGPKTAEARARLQLLHERLAEAKRLAEARPREPAAVTPGQRPPPEPAREPPPSFIPGLALLGGALGVAGVGLWFQLEARDLRRQISAELDPAGGGGTPPLDSGDPRFEEGRSAALRASIAWGVAGAVGVAGAILTVRAILGRSASGSASVGASLRPGGGGVALEVVW